MVKFDDSGVFKDLANGIIVSGVYCLDTLINDKHLLPEVRSILNDKSFMLENFS